MTYGLSDRSYKELLEILASVPEVEEAVIYGSRARGDNWAASDIDLSLKGDNLTHRCLRVLNDRLGIQRDGSTDHPPLFPPFLAHP